MYPHVSMPVIFRDRKQDQPQAAVITCVHSDVCVNVVVFMDRDRWPNERRTSIAFFPTEADAQAAHRTRRQLRRLLLSGAGPWRRSASSQARGRSADHQRLGRLTSPCDDRHDRLPSAPATP
jgi:hypothetical protein